MANAAFNASERSAYDDQIERWYHFPEVYLERAKEAIGELIAYYEPRRNAGRDSAGGRSAYFAVARLVRIEKDSVRPGHYYGHVDNFLEFDRAVAFREEGLFYESALRKEDGSTNKGAFGHSVRLIPRHEFEGILKAGMTTPLAAWEESDRISEPVPEYVIRPIVEQVVLRKFREVAFRRHVRKAYGNTCAVTGLRLINGGGRPEVQAAHIRPVEQDGPDTVRNGVALTGTAHWLFDRGLISFDDDYSILLSPQGVPDDMDKLIRSERKLLVPHSPEWRPHETYLNWHRQNRFKR
jgi:putative restriction endonuclease